MQLINFYVTFKNDPRAEYQYILPYEKFQNFLKSNKSRIVLLRLEYIGHSDDDKNEYNNLDFETRKFLAENNS